jgi:hypothetical protein
MPQSSALFISGRDGSRVFPGLSISDDFLSALTRNAVDKIALCVLRDVLRCSIILSLCNGGGFASDV